jgi:hypothetical protein
MSVKFPRMVTVRQSFPHSAPFDIRATVQDQLAQKLGSRIQPGARIAVAVGSRGISNLPLIVSVAVNWLKERGALPFIIPAMGSHGGATPEGQAGILSGYGINEETMGVPIRASLEVKLLGATDDGTEVYCSTEALSADGILLINRVKPHTDFSGKIGSGLLKIITIGLGKRMGAGTCHAAFAALGHERVIRKVSGLSLRCAPILGGVAILEDQAHESADVVVLGNEEMEAQEEQLFARAKDLMPKLPFEDIDFLIVDRMGKNISGGGMDPNIIGRSVYGYSSMGPSLVSMSSARIKRIFVRDLTEESHGNAIGVGLADMTTARLVRAMNPQATYVNALTGLAPLMAKIPMYFETDSEAITCGLASLGIPDTSAARVVRIADTLSLELLQVAETYSDQLAQREDITALDKPQEMKFDPQENLLPISEN